MGEADVYDRLDLRVRARVGGELVLLDRAVLEPAARPLASLGRHGPYPVSAALYLIGPSWPDIPTFEEVPGLLTAVAANRGYHVVRVFGPTAQAVSRAITQLIVTNTGRSSD